MPQINWLRVLPYLAVIATIGGLFAYGKIEHHGKLIAEQRYSQLQTDIAIERATAKAENDAKLSIANGKINAQAANIQSMEAQLAKLGITRAQTEKQLNETLSKLDNFKSANSLLWKRTSQDSVREGQPSEVLQLPSESDTKTISTVSAGIIYQVGDYESCIAQVKAIYEQHKQPIHFTDEP